jgi:large subunit ribosomal protein L7/L12
MMALRIGISTATRSASLRAAPRLTLARIKPTISSSLPFSYPSSYPSTSPSSSFHSTSNLNDNDAQSPKVDQVFDKILQLDLVEVHLLTELVNEKLGIKPMTAAQRAAMAGGGGGGGSAAGAAPAEEPEEKTAFDLKLTGFDAKSKIKVIKVVRAITGLGLKEAKEMVEGAPKTIKKEIKMEECEEIKAQLEAVGGTVEIS